ncbi:hypothetical protein ACWDKQ_05715 [Saccharopolyspora sp. NPDC000995]
MCKVTINEIAAQLNTSAGPEDIIRQVKHHTDVEIAVTTDWAGRPAFDEETATFVYATLTKASDNHSARWDAYQKYLQERKVAALAEAQEAAREAHEEMMEDARRRQESIERVRAEENAQKAAEEAAERARRAGSPLDFYAFDQDNR